MIATPVGVCARCNELLYKDCTNRIVPHDCPKSSPVPIPSVEPKDPPPPWILDDGRIRKK